MREKSTACFETSSKATLQNPLVLFGRPPIRLRERRTLNMLVMPPDPLIYCTQREVPNGHSRDIRIEPPGRRTLANTNARLYGQAEFLALQDLSVIHPEKVGVQDGLDNARTDSDWVEKRRVLDKVSVEPVGNIQCAVYAEC